MGVGGVGNLAEYMIRIGSGGGRVVKLLACGARGPGFDSRSRHLEFQRLSPASKSRYGWNTAKATYILNATNQCNDTDKMENIAHSNSIIARINSKFNYCAHTLINWIGE